MQPYAIAAMCICVVYVLAVIWLAVHVVSRPSKPAREARKHRAARVLARKSAAGFSARLAGYIAQCNRERQARYRAGDMHRRTFNRFTD